MKKFLVLLAVVFCFAGCTKEETDFASKWKLTEVYINNVKSSADNVPSGSFIFDKDGFCKFYYNFHRYTGMQNDVILSYKKKGNTITFNKHLIDFKRDNDEDDLGEVRMLFNDYVSIIDDGTKLVLEGYYEYHPTENAKTKYGALAENSSYKMIYTRVVE